MSLISRVKRLWELSGTPSIPPQNGPDAVFIHSEDQVKIVPVTSVQQIAEIALKPKRMATIVQDDPLDIFPNDETGTTEKPPEV